MIDKCYICGKGIPAKQTREWKRLPTGEIDFRPRHISCRIFEAPRARLSLWQRLINRIK